MVELQLLRGIDRTRRTTEDDTLGLFAGESFLRALTDKIALDFGGKTECEGKNLAGDIITKPVVVLNRPDTTAASHADIENLHDHEQVTAESGKFGTNNEIAAPYFAEKLSKTPDGPVLGSAYRLLYPAVDGDVMQTAELENLEALILYSLLVTAHSDVSVIHNTYSTIITTSCKKQPVPLAQCRMHRQVQHFQN